MWVSRTFQFLRSVGSPALPRPASYPVLYCTVKKSLFLVFLRVERVWSREGGGDSGRRGADARAEGSGPAHGKTGGRLRETTAPPLKVGGGGDTTDSPSPRPPAERGGVKRRGGGKKPKKSKKNLVIFVHFGATGERGGMGFGGFAGAAYLLPLLLAVAYLALRSERVVPRNRLPAHLQGHMVFAQRDLISAPMAKSWWPVWRIGRERRYPANTADTKFYETANEHVGEARPVREADGGCDHPYLIPNRNRTLCTLAGRIDIGRHLILTGGARGLREPYEKIISRVQSFGAYHFDLAAYPVVERLFKEESFQSAAKRVCPAHKRHLDPFQFNFILQVPGQTVSTHVDGVYFWGASRMQFPQWLLAAMKFSGLWEDVFVDQVQVVGYLHSWSPAGERH